MTKIINDWSTTELIPKDKVLHFDFLLDKKYIENVSNTEYYYLVETLENVEYEVYKHCNEQMKEEMNIIDCDKEIKHFIKELHIYNELKDIGQALVNKIAEKRGNTSKEVIKDLGYDSLD